MKPEIKFLIEGLIFDLAGFLMKDYKLQMKAAMNLLYNSETFSKLSNPDTGLYCQSSRYVYSFLQDELDMGRL